MVDDNFLNEVLRYSFVPTMCSVEDMLREQLPEEVKPQFEAKYHEVGIVKEGNRITGAIVKEVRSMMIQSGIMCPMKNFFLW